MHHHQFDPIRALFPALASLLLAAPSLAQDFDWRPDFSAGGVQGPTTMATLRAVLAVPNAGGADTVYLGGNFEAISGCPLRSIATWDGATFRPLSQGATGGNGVSSIAEFQGDVYVGGGALEFDGVPYSAIARWDGTAWSSLPALSWVNGSIAIVSDLVSFDDGSGPGLFAVGLFNSAGGTPVNNVAKWTGSEWQALGDGLDQTVGAAAVWDDGSGPHLYAAGVFENSGATPIEGVARWSGSQWEAVGVGGPLAGYAITGFQDANFGGLFVSNSGTIRRFDGVAWSTVATEPVRSFEIFDAGAGPRLFGASPGRLLEWSGGAWSLAATIGVENAGSGCQELAVADLGAHGGRVLIAAGAFDSISAASLSTPLDAGGIALFDGATWSAPASAMAGGLDNNVNAFARFNDGRGEALYLGGAFDNANGAPASRIARWDGEGFEALGAGVSGNVNALVTFDDGTGEALYVGGAFQNAGGAPAKRVARWDGLNWSPLGAGLNSTVECLAVFDDGSGPALIAGGQFNNSGGASMAAIARWNGTAWTPLGFGFNDTVHALAVYDDGSGPALYAGGEFTQSFLTPINRLARWNGSSWMQVGGGVDAMVLALLADGSDLYVGGEFNMVGATQINHLARWNGSSWSSVTIPWPTGRVQCMTQFDAGEGPRLVVGGRFTGPASKIGIVEGTQLVPLGDSVNGHVAALAVFDDGHATRPALYAGGPFTSAGSFSSAHIARWANGVVPPPTSYCTAGTTSNGCQALIGSSGEPSRCADSGFEVSVNGVEGQKLGIFFFGNAPIASHWGLGTSFVCIAPPTIRASTQFSGGTNGACDGSFQLDFNAWMYANPDRSPLPGDIAYLQAWFRDPASPKGTSLSDALRIEVAP